MKLEKATEILALYDKEVDIPPIPDFKDALKLGIEALKFVEADRAKYPYVKVPLLPGETEE